MSFYYPFRLALSFPIILDIVRLRWEYSFYVGRFLFLSALNEIVKKSKLLQLGQIMPKVVSGTFFDIESNTYVDIGQSRGRLH